MKKLLLIAIAFCTFTACDDDDNSELWDEVKNQGNKIEMLESEIEALKLKIEGLNQTYKAISEMLNGGLITGVEEVTDGDKKGYTFTVQTGTEINTYTIWNGETVAAPQLGVEKEEETGLYYWTLDGEPLLNADGEKIYSAKAPQLRINSSSEWEISYDDGATWKNLGVFTGTVVSNSIEVEVVDGVVVIKQDGKTDIEIPLTPKNTLGITFTNIDAAAGLSIMQNSVYVVKYEPKNAENATVKVEMLNGTNFEVENVPGENKFKVTAKGQDASDVVLVHVYDGTVCMHTSFNITSTSAITEPKVVFPLEQDEERYTVELNLPETTTGEITFSITSDGTLPDRAVTIPSTVTLTDGRGSFDITVNSSTLTPGIAYTLQLVFSKEAADYEVLGSVTIITGVLAKIDLTKNMFQSRYTCPNLNDGGKIEALCDGDATTYWGSNYGNTCPDGDATYGIYIDVMLPCRMVCVSFHYHTRNGGGLPKKLAIGAGNGGEYTLLGTYDQTVAADQDGETPVYYREDKTSFNKVRFGMTLGAHNAGAPEDEEGNGILTGPLGGTSFANNAALAELEVWGLQY